MGRNASSLVKRKGQQAKQHAGLWVLPALSLVDRSPAISNLPAPRARVNWSLTSCSSTPKNNTGVTLMHSHQMATVVLAAVIFLFDSLREKRSVPQTK